MITFKEFWLLSEMSVGEFSIFDSDDRAYYKYIYDHMPSRFREDKDLLRKVIQQAIYYRYGRADKKGVLHRPELHNSDNQDITFNLRGAGEFTVKGVPVKPQNLINKLDMEWRWNHPDFGYGNSSWDPLKKTAAAYVNWLETGKEPSHRSDTIFGGKYKHISKKYADDLDLTKDKREGVKKKKAATTDEFTRKSTVPIPLDAEDDKFLNSVETQFIKKYIEPNRPKPRSQKEPPSRRSKGVHDWDTPLLVDVDKDAEKAILKVMAMALTARYSNKFVTQDEAGNFKPVVDGQMYGDIHISGVKIPGFNHVVLNDIYVNAPHLAKKFKKYQDSNNFVKEPLTKNAALQWLDHDKKEYRPWHATVGGSHVPDPVFYKIISQDHDLWRKSEGAVRGVPVRDEDMAEKLTWRRGDQIVESPNIEDMASVKRDIRNMTWDQIIHDDANRAVKGTIDQLGRTKFINDKDFKTRIQPVFDEILQDVLTDLMVRKTGMGDQYRSELRRIRWGNNAAEVAIKKLFLKDSGKGEDQSGEEQTLDPRSRESAPNTNVIAPEKGIEPESEYERDTDDNPEWDAEVARMTQQSMPQGPQGPQKPPGLSMLLWMRARTPEEKQKLIQQYTATNKV